MIVEDEYIVAEDIKEIVRSLRYAVPAIASSGEEAMQKTAEVQPDLVLMDIRLRGEIDGIETAAAIWDRFHIPIIYLTAYADDNTIQRAKIGEPFGYILKPFEERMLHSTIEMALYKHKMEKQLRESKEWHAAALRCIGDAVIATDREGHVTFMNPMAETLTGWRQEEALGRDVAEVSEIISLIGNPVAQALRKGEIVNLPDGALLIAKDGTEIPIDDSAAPIMSDNGNVAGAILVFHDATVRKRAEEERVKSILDLQEALGRIKTLRGFLPICASCKKIRDDQGDDDQGDWKPIEAYIQEHSEAKFSHSICPECKKKLYPEFSKDQQE